MDNVTGFMGLLFIWGLLYGFYVMSTKSFQEHD